MAWCGRGTCCWLIYQIDRWPGFLSSKTWIQGYRSIWIPKVAVVQCSFSSWYFVSDFVLLAPVALLAKLQVREFYSEFEGFVFWVYKRVGCGPRRYRCPDSFVDSANQPRFFTVRKSVVNCHEVAAPFLAEVWELQSLLLIALVLLALLLLSFGTVALIDSA